MESFNKAQGFGPYKLHAKIGKGGVADLFLGTSSKQKDQGHLLAIKKLLPNLSANRPFVEMLVNEAKVGVLLQHPSIASVYDLGSHQSEFFIAMEYVHGKSLDKLNKAILTASGIFLSFHESKNCFSSSFSGRIMRIPSNSSFA